MEGLKRSVIYVDKNTQRMRTPTKDDRTIIKIVSIRGRRGDGGTTDPVLTETRKRGGHCETVGEGEAGDVVGSGDEEGVVRVRMFEL
jgi:hypothetical protein